jgi:flagellar biosynthesis protein FlhF
MQIRTFQAATMNEAVQRVKKELGPDAVILGNRKITVSPSQTLIEITAAIEPEQKPFSPASPAPSGDVQVQEDLHEIKGLLSMLISSKGYFSQLQLQEPLAQIYHNLLMRGLDEKHTFIALKKTVARMKGTDLERKRIIAGFCQQLLEKITVATPFRDIAAAKPEVFTFVGPTGVGKTTTLAKLAAYLKIKRGLEVGIVSVDTYRIGAVDQLQTYAEILDVPLLVAQSSAEVQESIHKFRRTDVVLVDTVGKNFLQRDHVANMQETFAGCGQLQHFLVVSAAAKDEDLRQTIRQFRSFGIHSLIFTKIDETLTPGSMINQLLRFPFPVSYVGTGQRVPEDLEPASRKLLLELLFPLEKTTQEREQHDG